MSTGRLRFVPRHARMTMLRLALITAALVLGLAACSSTSRSYDRSKLEGKISTALDRHPGFQVQSVTCPQHAKVGKGLVITCDATNRDGHVVRMRAIQVDGKGSVRLIANEMFADNVERGIVATLAQHGINAGAVCPEHVPVVIGSRFDCRVVEKAGRQGAARITILNSNGAFTVHVS